MAHIILVVAIGAIVSAAYASVVFAPTGPKATWAINPLTINVTAGTGSAPDSVTCTSGAGFVQFLGKSSNPAVIKVSTLPTGTNCGTVPTPVAITATCLVPATQCVGTYSGQVQIRQPANYRNLPEILKLTIIVR